MAKNYLMRLYDFNHRRTVFINPLQLVAVDAITFTHNGEKGSYSDIITNVSEIDEGTNIISVSENGDEVNKEFTRALNAMFSEFGQQLKDASIYDIQHRR